jgi:hypothetical protein
MEEFLSLNTLLFLHRHSDQIKTIAPTLICFLNLWSIMFSQFPKILVILHGRNKVEATWMTDHIDLENRHWKNKCFIILFWWKKTQILLPCQFCFARLSLVKTPPLCRYHPNTFIRNGILNFQSLLLLILLIGASGRISALYIEAIVNLPNVDSTGIHHVQTVVGYLPNVEVKHSMIQVVDQTNPSRTQHLEEMSPLLWR